MKAQSAAAGQVGGYIWVLGGKTSGTGSHVLGGAIDRVDRYDPATNTWVANIASLDTPRAGAAYATRGQNIYLLDVAQRHLRGSRPKKRHPGVVRVLLAV